MRIDRLAELGCYDSLYVSPHGADVALSCASRIRSERAEGRRVLVAVVFASADDPQGWRDEIAVSMARLDVDHFLVEEPHARERRPEHAWLRSRVYGRFLEDEACLGELTVLLDALRGRVKPRQLYLPLAVGADIDHRLCQEAGLHALSAQAGQSVFLYEERPHVFVPGAVRIRLGQLGASLPPAAADIGDRAGLLRFLFRLNASPTVWGEQRGFLERVRFASLAARDWKRARSWQPQKGLGLRVQPVLHEGSGADGEVSASATQYTRRLGGSGPIERYWLVLPPRERDGVTIVPPLAEVGAR